SLHLDPVRREVGQPAVRAALEVKEDRPCVTSPRPKGDYADRPVSIARARPAYSAWPVRRARATGATSGTTLGRRQHRPGAAPPCTPAPHPCKAPDGKRGLAYLDSPRRSPRRSRPAGGTYPTRPPHRVRVAEPPLNGSLPADQLLELFLGQH